MSIYAKQKKLNKVDVIVGIPTYNEADNIGFVTRQVDSGLRKFCRHLKCLIINADNHSPDNTKAAFLKVKTNTPKMHIDSGEKNKGKGVNVFNILKEATRLEAEAILLFDGDLKSIEPVWIKKYAETILNGYDFIAPIYVRNEYDGSITNNLCYPLLASFFSVNIRQPIGGDFGISKKFANFLVKESWDKNILKYGVDIFLTVSAITENMKIAQVFLGRKEHKPSLPKLGPMYIQVADTLFKLLVKNNNLWKNSRFKSSKILYKNEKIDTQDMAIDYKYLKIRSLSEFSSYRRLFKKFFDPPLFQKLEHMFFKEKNLSISDKFWREILATLWTAYYKSKNNAERKEIIISGRPFYFARQASFIKDSLEMSHEEAEEMIVKQAKLFYNNRKKFIGVK